MLILLFRQSVRNYSNIVTFECLTFVSADSTLFSFIVSKIEKSDK